ncbi:MAG: GNAT family N-acetyltransferase [Clostridia bacterium]|nr:GNAT family N-acetyltransferase [Clostridia bacterium]
MKVISIRENPEYYERGLAYIQDKWASGATLPLYEDCIFHALKTERPLPQWYLLLKADEIIGCAGLITNDFISRMDLYPWMCALFIDVAHRGKHYGQVLIEQAKADAKKIGFKQLYLCTDHVGYYEKYDFTYIGDGYHPWGDQSRIYQCDLLGGIENESKN